MEPLEELRTRISLIESILTQLKENDEIVERLVKDYTWYR